MFALIRPPAGRRCVDRGSVSCPLRQRDVEVDLCAGCGWKTEIDLEAEPPFVRCRPEMSAAQFARIWP